MFWHKSRMAICLLVLLASNTISIITAQAQTPSPVQPAPAQASVQSASVQSGSVSPASASSAAGARIGIDPTKPAVTLSLRDTVTMAIEHNLDAQLEKDNILRAQYGLQAAQGVYDTTLHANFRYFVDSFPITSVLIRSFVSPTNVTGKSYSYNGGFSRLFAAGGLLNVQFDNRRLRTDEAFSILSLEYRSKAAVTFTMPLMRNFRINEHEYKIRSLKKQLDISDMAFRQKLIDLIAYTQAAYYDLAFAIKSEEILRESVALAESQLKLVELQVQAGTVAPVEIVSSQAELQLRQDDAIAAQLAITRAENLLKNIILDDPDSEIWRSRIVPLDPIEFTHEPIEVQRAIDTAMAQRPELKQLELQDELNKIDLSFFKNQQKPQVDLFSSFSLQNVIGEGNTNNPPKEFVGNYFEGLQGIYKFRSYSAGVTFSFNRGNHTAKANIAKTLVSERQVETRKRKMTQTIISEVTNAVEAVEAAVKRVDAAHAAVVDAETQLKVEQERFEVGFSTNFLVLAQQNSLSLARGRELRARIDYIEARAELQRVMANNIP